MNKFNKTLIALALAGATMTAHAHKPWLLPTSTIVESRDNWVTIDAAVSEGLFDVDHVPLKQAVALVADATGAARNALYESGLAWRQAREADAEADESDDA